MKVTFDTNSFGPISSPEDYSENTDLEFFSEIRTFIGEKKIKPYISEGSLGLEALEKNDRIDKFIREWATKKKGIELPKPSPIRVKIVNKALKMGFKVLRVPRIALGSFIEVPRNSWVADEMFSISERQERYFKFARKFDYIGPSKLKNLGTELVLFHGIDTSRVIQFTGWPKPEELAWAKGIVAEYDSPKKFKNAKKFTNHIREIIAEWNDLDIFASHYAYGLELFCTNDRSKSTGSNGIFHNDNHINLAEDYNIRFISPSDLVHLIKQNA